MMLLLLSTDPGEGFGFLPRKKLPGKRLYGREQRSSAIMATETVQEYVRRGGVA